MDLIKSKILSEENLDAKLSLWRFKNKKIVFTNGCFDIIHLGHIDYLSKARNLGSILFLGLNTDDSVSRIKGTTRPINDQYARAMILASFQFIDAIYLFDEDTPYDLIKKVQPDILVKGSDYTIDEIVGADIVQANGGEIVTIDFLEGYSTTRMINKIKSE